MDETKRTISRALVVVSFCAWAVFLTNLHRDQKSTRETNFAVKDKSWSSSSWPKLMKYGGFLDRLESRGEPVARTASLEQLRRLLVFNGDLIDVGQHNLKTLFGLDTYYIQQIWSEWSELDADSSNETNGANLQEVEPAVKAPFFGLFDKSHRDDKSAQRRDLTYLADHRDCLGPARDQKGCGSCYAFSVVSLIEWHYCKQYGNQLADFSEQYAIDCGRVVDVDGCNEGKLSHVKDFYNLFGLKREVDWPYTGKDPKRLSCSDDETETNRIQMHVRPWRRIPIGRKIFEKTLERQPILVSFLLPADFRKYKRGLYEPRACSARRKHGMLLVGHGLEDGKQFWLLRNSYGEHWGELGYVRVLKMDDIESCFQAAFVSKFKFNDDEEKSDAFYESFDYFPPELKAAKRNGLSRALLDEI